MDESRFGKLLDGEQPTLDEFGAFVSVVEKLPSELLWKLVTATPKLHPVLREVALKSLSEKVARQNVDDALDAIVTRLAQH